MSVSSSADSSPYVANSPQTYVHSLGVATGSSKPRPKPANVFSNDGSFLNRFQKMKKEEEDKKRAEEVSQRKLAFQDRFKHRGKRPAPKASTTSVSDQPRSKRLKSDNHTPHSSGSSSKSTSVSPAVYATKGSRAVT